MITYRVEHVSAAAPFRVRVAFADGSVFYATSERSADDAVDQVLRLVEAADSPAAAFVRLARN